MNHDLITTTLKSLDSAPATDPDDTSKRRSAAHLQRILAVNFDQPNRAKAMKRSASFARRVALPVAVAAAAAGLLVAPGISNPDPAFASWTPQPVRLDAAEQKIAGDACLDEWRDEGLVTPQLVLAERRGEWVGVVYTDAAPAVTMCLMYLPQGSDHARNVHAGRSGGQGAIPVRGEFTDGAMSQMTDPGLFGIGEHPTASFNVGDVGPDVEAVTITTADGNEVNATVENGRFLAWWPGRVFGDKTEGNGGPAPDVSYQVTLRDGTVVDDAQTIRPE